MSLGIVIDIFWCYSRCMRTTVTVDDALLDRASKLSGITERATLIRTGLEALIAQESAKRLIRLGGSDPGAEAAPRRRPS